MPQKDNVGPGDRTAAVGADPAEQLRHYDALPPEWRALVDAAPVQADVRQFTAVLALYGHETGWRLVCEVLERDYPGWTRQQIGQPRQRRSRK